MTNPYLEARRLIFRRFVKRFNGDFGVAKSSQEHGTEPATADQSIHREVR